MPETKPAFTLTIVRHGSTWYVEAPDIPYKNSMCTPLSEKGMEDVRKLSDFFKKNNHKFSHIISSDYLRTFTTARGMDEWSPIVTDIRIREKDTDPETPASSTNERKKWGQKENKSLVDVICGPGKYPDLYQSTMDRLRSFWKELLERFLGPEIGSSVLVVTHAGFIMLWLMYLTTLPGFKSHLNVREESNKQFVPPSSVTTIRVERGENDVPIITLLDMGNIDHLQH